MRSHEPSLRLRPAQDVLNRRGSRPLLQVAIDTLPLSGAVALATSLAGIADLIEAGTPFIKREGMAAVRGLRTAVSESLVVADMKTMDAGALEVRIAIDAGADVVTVLGCASDATILAAIDAAHSFRALVVVDLIGVPDKPRRALELVALGVDAIGIHTGTDDQATGADPLADLAAVRAVVDAPIVVAGGITIDRLQALMSWRPDVVIAGSFITGAPDPKIAARELRAALERFAP